MNSAPRVLPASPLQGERNGMLVLASASPRREALLRQAGISIDHILAPDVDESPKKAELPRDYVLRLALAKLNVAARYQNSFVLAADTVVCLGRRILPKAQTVSEVEQCLSLLSGRRHQVLTAVALAVPGKKIRTRIVATRVAFKVLTRREIAAYTASGEGIGKAGGYAIQGRAETLVRSINGSYSNVVGLPLNETIAMLEGSGWRNSE